MKSVASSPAHSTNAWALSQALIDEQGLGARLHLLGPAAEFRHPAPHAGDRVLFVSMGSVTVENGRTNYILQPETALRLPAGAPCALRNHGDSLAKVLVLDLPPPRPMRPSDSAVATIG